MGSIRRLQSYQHTDVNIVSSNSAVDAALNQQNPEVPGQGISGSRNPAKVLDTPLCYSYVKSHTAFFMYPHQCSSTIHVAYRSELSEYTYYFSTIPYII